jgi:hypothetical protein
MSDKSSPTTQGPATQDPTHTEQRVSVLVGDRLCVSCGFNLHGQHVVRESKYNMLMVRCPECGAVASLQEFPLLGKWTTRWAAALAVIWLLLLLGLTLGTAGATFGLSSAVVRTSVTPVAREISRRHSEWYRGTQEAEAQAARESAEAAALASLEARTSAQQTILTMTQLQAAGTTLTAEQIEAMRSAAITLQQVTQPQPLAVQTQTFPDWYGDMWIEESWWKSQDKRELAASAGTSFNADSVRMLLVSTLVLLAFGVIFGVVLIHARSRRRALACLIVLAFTWVFWTAGGQSNSTTWSGGTTFLYVNDLAPEFAGTGPFALASAWCMAVLFAGMRIGRPLVRLLIRLLLPPRIRGPLAILWTTDGLPPPSIR